jgi:acetylornithine deacetylase/succinyl-diaminopimelate desuccinylase-like protein
MGTPHVLRSLDLIDHARKEEITGRNLLFIAGERTGEKGDEIWGNICVENRGIMRFEISATGVKGHSGVASISRDLTARILDTRMELDARLTRLLTLNQADGWQSQIRYPFLLTGSKGIYNITPDKAVIGVEIRSVPQDKLEVIHEELVEFCSARELSVSVNVMEDGIKCDEHNPTLMKLIAAVREVSNKEPIKGKKLAGTSARFAPYGQGIVWGQSGIGPHTNNERHYIPSIFPYYQALDHFARTLIPGIRDD